MKIIAMVLLIWLFSLCISVLSWRWGHTRDAFRVRRHLSHELCLPEAAQSQSNLWEVWDGDGSNSQVPSMAQGDTTSWLLGAVAKLPQQRAVAMGRLKICRTQPFCLDVPSPVDAGKKNQLPKKLYFLKYINCFRLAKGNCRLSRVMYNKSTCD